MGIVGSTALMRIIVPIEPDRVMADRAMRSMDYDPLTPSARQIILIA
jgi:hypothetical protein